MREHSVTIDWSKVKETHVEEACSRYDRCEQPKREIYMITYDDLKVLTP